MQIRWLLVPAATFVLVICSFLAGRVSVHPERVTEALPPKQAIADATAPQTVEQSAQSTPLSHPTAEQSKRAASAGRRIAGSEVRPMPSLQQQTAETAALTPPASTSLDAPQPAGVSTPPAPVSPVAQSDSAIQAAQTPGLATSAPTQRPTDLGAIQAPPAPGIKSVVASHSGGASVPGARTDQPSAIPAPAEIRLEAGTRVWISLKSVRERVDGVSDFSGVVLLPVVQSGTVLLERSTQISGVIGVRQGKTAVQIMELVSNGARYRLKGTGESASTRPEMGTAVKFDAGKVLETWIVSASIFGKLPKEIGATGK